jgi:hypothetical protein
MEVTAPITLSSFAMIEKNTSDFECGNRGDLPLEWDALNFGLTPIMFALFSLINFLWHVLILLPSEEGWAKAGIEDKKPIN